MRETTDFAAPEDLLAGEDAAVAEIERIEADLETGRRELRQELREINKAHGFDSAARELGLIEGLRGRAETLRRSGLHSRAAKFETLAGKVEETLTLSPLSSCRRPRPVFRTRTEEKANRRKLLAEATAKLARDRERTYCDPRQALAALAARLPEGRKHYNAAVADALIDVILRKKSTERYGLFLAVTLTNLMKLGALDYDERYLQRVVDVCEGGLGCRPAGV